MAGRSREVNGPLSAPINRDRRGDYASVSERPWAGLFSTSNRKQEVQVLVTLLDGTELPLELHGTDTLRQIKTRVEANAGIPACEQVLWHVDGSAPESDDGALIGAFDDCKFSLVRCVDAHIIYCAYGLNSFCLPDQRQGWGRGKKGGRRVSCGNCACTAAGRR